MTYKIVNVKKTIMGMILSMMIGSVALFISAFPVIAVAAKYEHRGVDKGCEWTLDQNGKLTIRSVWEDSNLRNNAWVKFKDQIKEIDIDVSYSNNLYEMFRGFDKLEKGKVKIDKCEGIASYMFACGMGRETYGYSNLVELDLSQMDTSGVTYMNEMFGYCVSLEKLNLNGWDTKKVTSMTEMFMNCTSLKSLKIKHFNTGSVTKMDRMFWGCDSLEEINLAGWNMPLLETTTSMFYNCGSLRKINLSGWKTPVLTDMRAMFGWCKYLEDVNIKGWTAPKVNNMDFVFEYCKSLKNLDLSGFTTGEVKSMNGLFMNCSKLENLKIDGWDVSKVWDMRKMFYYCKSLVTLDLSKFEAKSIGVAYSMFSGCSSLQKIDLSHFYFTDQGQLSDVMNIFNGCVALKEIKAPIKLDKIQNGELPGKVWYRDDTGEKITKLPINLKKTTTLYKAEEGNPFYDVASDSWQYVNVIFAYDNYLMEGVKILSSGLIVFEPDRAITRAEFVQILYNNYGTPTVKYKNVFTDVPKGKWYSNAILWAYEQKLVSGIGNKKFGVNDKITRQDMVTILYKYAEKCNKKFITGASEFSIKAYTDHQAVDKYAVLPMKWAAGNKVMNGKPIGGDKYKLDPKGNATRAECATVMKNYLKFTGKKDK